MGDYPSLAFHDIQIAAQKTVKITDGIVAEIQFHQFSAKEPLAFGKSSLVSLPRLP